MSLLSIQNLGKAFRSYSSEWKRFARWFGLPMKHRDEHWVLRHVNFEIYPGEAIGIIGQNGAGKSTLLKMITGTLHPSEGEVQVNGRIAAILELGMGFDPELTGRQNVFHAAGLMGYSAKQIQQTMPEIEAFSEIGEYFDETVRIYSSGMQMRVAFAVATAFLPDILIVDEALSVGDAAFQRKCFRRIEKYMNDGMALLLVSHDIESIKKICSKALFLKDGVQLEFGDSKSICDNYEQDLFGSKGKVQKNIEEATVEREGPLIDPDLLIVNELNYGDGRAIIKDVWLENVAGNQLNIIEIESHFILKYIVDFEASVKFPVFTFLIKTLEGISLYGTNTLSLGGQPELFVAGDRLEVSFLMKNTLAAGTYFINCGVRDDNSEDSIFIHRRVDVAMFKVRQKVGVKQVGLVNFGAKFSSIKKTNQIDIQ